MKPADIIKFLEQEKFKTIDEEYSSFDFYEKQKAELQEAGIKQISLKSFIESIKKSKNYSLLKKNLDKLKCEFLYTSDTHGISHNLRTTLFGFFISEKLGLDEKDLQFVLYGTLYHDIGRRNDHEDAAHGALGAAKLDQLELPLDEDETKILKCAITGHSLDDKDYEKVEQKYNAKDKKRCKLIYQILKDSDGLDRVRLKYPYVGMKFLRTEISKQIILAAYELEYNFHV